MPELILATAAYPAGGLIAGVLGAAVGILVVIIIVEGASTEPVAPRLIPTWVWLAFWIPLGLILVITDMPGWLRTLLFVIPLGLTVGLFNRRAA
jgi:hypothetical protein